MRIVHCKRESYTNYIGRPSALGNQHPCTGEPCPVAHCKGAIHDRIGCIMAFYDDVRASKALQDEIRALPEDAVLGCWCAPKPCHGSVIEGVWYLLHEGKELPEWREGKLLGE